MTITLDLPGELANTLTADAARLGLSLSEYAARLLTQKAGVPSMASTGADLVAYWQEAGVIGSRPDITDPDAYARELRTEAENRRLNDSALE